MKTPRRRRCLAAGLVLSQAILPACGSVEANLHRSGGEPPSVRVKAFWEDAEGHKHLVGGLNYELIRLYSQDVPEPVSSATSESQEPSQFADLEPGRYRLLISGGELKPFAYDFELPRRRRVTIRLDVEGVAEEQAGAGPPGALHILGGIGLMGVVLILDGLFDEDLDDC